MISGINLEILELMSFSSIEAMVEKVIGIDKWKKWLTLN